MIQWRLARYIICSPGIKFSSTYPIGSSSKPDQILWQRSPKSTLIPIFCSLVLGAVTDLKTISAGILEEDGVVTGFPWLGNFMNGSFDVPSSCTDGDLSQSINLAGAARPERDATFVRTVLGRLSDAEKLGGAVAGGGLELQPSLDSDVASEPKCGQECLVEPSCLGKAAHSEVNVIVASLHSENGLSSENVGSVYLENCCMAASTRVRYYYTYAGKYHKIGRASCRERV